MIITVSTILLVLLWTYTATSKIGDLPEFRAQLHKQPISNEVAQILAFALPAGELMVAVFLVFQRTRLIGMIASVILMTVFTTYIILALTRNFEKMPCSCGGVLNILTWRAHLIFNILFLALAMAGCLSMIKIRKAPDQIPIR